MCRQAGRQTDRQTGRLGLAWSSRVPNQTPEVEGAVTSALI